MNFIDQRQEKSLDHVEILSNLFFIDFFNFLHFLTKVNESPLNLPQLCLIEKKQIKLNKMKVHLPLIPFLVLFLFVTNSAKAQHNLSPKIIQFQNMRLNDPTSNISYKSDSSNILNTSFTLSKIKTRKFLKTFSDINTPTLLDYSNQIIPSQNQNQNMFSARHFKYSSLWAFTSLNYLYADLVGLMDVNLLSQYQTGIVNGVEITPVFLTAAAAYMQIPLSNVFLPHVIKNEKALRWVQIISGSIATLVQGATLFVGKPSPYYMLFSAIEMGATAFITIDAIRWKTGKKQKSKPMNLY